MFVDEEDVVDRTAAERDIALVFQYYSLYPRYTVRQNLEFPLRAKIRSYSQAAIDARIASAAKTLRIEHLLERKTDKLSGGEMQRVAIGRAIVREPRAFLMDEPLSNLDAKLREALRSELKDLQMKLGATFVFVTHDKIEAMSMGDKIGKVTTLSGKIELGLSGVAAKEAGRSSAAVTVGIRAEDVLVGPAGSAEAKIHHVENHGVEQILTLRVDGQLVKATVPASMPAALDGGVRFSFRADKVHCFDGATGVSLDHPAPSA